MSKARYEGEWLSDKIDTPEFRRAYERERMIEGFLGQIEDAMGHRNMSRSDLAAAAKCSRSNITQLLQRTRNLTAETMVDLAFHMGQRVVCELHPLGKSMPLARKMYDWSILLDEVLTTAISLADFSSAQGVRWEDDVWENDDNEDKAEDDSGLAACFPRLAA